MVLDVVNVTLMLALAFDLFGVQMTNIVVGNVCKFMNCKLPASSPL